MNTSFLSLTSRSSRTLRHYVAAICLPAALAVVTVNCGDSDHHHFIDETPECACDAAISKIVLDEPVAGGAALYGLSVNYHGDASCKGEMLCVDDNLPSGLTCDPMDYVPGSDPDWDCSCTGSAVRCCLKDALPPEPTFLPMIKVPVVVASEVPEVIENCAFIEQDFPGSFADPISANNMSCVKSSVNPKPTKGVDLSIEKSHDLQFVDGGLGVFHLDVSNVGTVPVSGFTVTDVLPVGLTFVGASSSPWLCMPSGPTVTCTFQGTLPAMSSAVPLDIKVQIGGNEKFAGQNCATVSAKGDINASNDSDCDSYCIDYSKSFTSGVPDKFVQANGVESPSPSEDLKAWLAANYGVTDIRNYDDPSADQFFATTFTKLEPQPGHVICGAKLTILLQCDGSNDAMSLRFTDGTLDLTQLWTQYLTAAPFNSPCDGNTPTQITLDLADLPVGILNGMNASAQNLLPGLNSHGFLDVTVQDDTDVDFVKLDLTYCCE